MVASYGFTPKMISKLILHFAGGVGETTAAGLVTALADQSGRGNDVTFAAAHQPSAVASAINGNPGWLCDVATLGQGATKPFTAGGPMTVSSVCMAPADVGAGGYCQILTTRGTFTAGSNLVIIGAGAAGAGMIGWYGNSVACNLTPNATYLPLIPHIVTWQADVGVSTTPSVWVDGALQAVGGASVTADAAAGNFTILGHSANSSVSHNCEILAWDKALNAAERATVHRYLATKYSIAVQGVP